MAISLSLSPACINTLGHMTTLTQKYMQIWEDLLDPHVQWVDKLLQLNEVAGCFRAVSVTGPCACGKTAMVNTLCRALSAAGTRYTIVRLNPKAMTVQQMLGWTDASSSEWHEGVLAALWRNTTSKKAGQNAWVVLDGPVDAVWADNLQSAMDDGVSALILTNGDRSIALIPHVVAAVRDF
jgi:dynein heavy chain